MMFGFALLLFLVRHGSNSLERGVTAVLSLRLDLSYPRI
jgi:hypothetical protein